MHYILKGQYLHAVPWTRFIRFLTLHLLNTAVLIISYTTVVLVIDSFFNIFSVKPDERCLRNFT